ncbi:MAG: PH domain-containing protein [Pirellulaceae bacterium]
MSKRTEEMTRWVYEGLWGVLTRWFRVPRDPPSLPTQQGETVESFRPAAGFLRYLKLQFWVILFLIDAAILGAWLVLLVAVPMAGLLLLGPVIVIAVLPDLVAYVAIHLRYDTTWYVVSDRSLRIRRGIWIIQETTITFENVQNVAVSQGPLQRWFGIADLFVETAGGGGHSQQADKGANLAASHQGLIEGIGDAPRIRDLLLKRIRRSRSAGLGDEISEHPPREGCWTPEHMTTLRGIRDAVRALASPQ